MITHRTILMHQRRLNQDHTAVSEVGALTFADLFDRYFAHYGLSEEDAAISDSFCRLCRHYVFNRYCLDYPSSTCPRLWDGNALDVVPGLFKPSERGTVGTFSPFLESTIKPVNYVKQTIFRTYWRVGLIRCLAQMSKDISLSPNCGPTTNKLVTQILLVVLRSLPTIKDH